MSLVQDPPGLRLAPLATYLGRALEDLDAGLPVDAQLLAGGRSNVTYVLSQDGRRWVLRRPPLGNVMPSAHDMGREHRVLSGLTRAGFPVPRPLLLCMDETVIGAPFMVMEYVDGRVLEDGEDTAGLAPSEATALSEAFVATFARLHAVVPQDCGLGELGRPAGFLQRQVRRWADQWDRTKTRELPALDRLVRELGDRIEGVPADLPSSIVHGDYRLDNLILAHREPVVQAVLDWEMSTLGYPAADLAVSLVYWSQPTDVLRRRVPVAERATDAVGFWDRHRIAEEYSRRTGDGLDHLEPCLALACLKLAVIMESILKRTLDGRQLGQASADSGDMRQAVEALARMGTTALEGGGVEALGG
jgi:aminoglycoside phosphotransferase (APT) family kinase protein